MVTTQDSAEISDGEAAEGGSPAPGGAGPAETNEASRAAEATEQLCQELDRRFRERNFNNDYLARRCRTTARVIDAWRRGVAVPDRGEWSFLCQVSRDFQDLSELWRVATTTERARDRVDDLPLVHRPPWPRPAPRHPERAERAERPAVTDPPRPPPPASVAHVEEATAAAQPPAGPSDALPARTPAPPGDERTIRVPDGLVVFRCRISGGRVLEIPLPAELSRADVDRICAFLRTQADPE